MEQILALLLLPRPLAVDEDGRLGTVGSNAPDVEVIRPHHEVNVRVTLVDAGSHELILVHRETTLHALGEAHPKCKVATGVLVIQGVVEQNPTLANGRVLGNQSHLAKANGILVRLENVLQNVLA